MNQNFNDEYENNKQEETGGPAYYDPSKLGVSRNSYGNGGSGNGGNNGNGGGSWKKGLIIFLVIALVVVLAGAGCSRLTENILESAGLSGNNDSSDYEFTSDYIGVLQIHGTMSSSDGEEYNQKWLLKRISYMKDDPFNRGLILSINTPGGEVYAIDELYFAIKSYEEETGRPVYTYMENMCASGGYYTAAATEKIYANRNCWTGSIGVTIGTIYDISEFLEEHGIKTVTITSGDNKAMGSYVNPLTDEQKAIYQSLVDEAYEQFTGIVAEGRDMDIDKVKKLADGRIYTAKQAQENGLIDEIGTIDECIADMQKKYELESATPQTIKYVPDDTLRSLLGIIADNRRTDAGSELEKIMELAEENDNFTITYMSEIRK